MHLICLNFQKNNRFVYAANAEARTEALPADAAKHAEYIQEARNSANNPKASQDIKAKMVKIDALDKTLETESKQQAETLAKELVKGQLVLAATEKVAAAEKAAVVSLAGFELGSPQYGAVLASFLKDFGNKDLGKPIFKELMNGVNIPLSGNAVARFNFEQKVLQIKPGFIKGAGSGDKVTWEKYGKNIPL